MADTCLWVDIRHVMCHPAGAVFSSACHDRHVECWCSAPACMLTEHMLGRTALTSETCTSSMQICSYVSWPHSFESLQTRNVQHQVSSSNPTMPLKGHLLLSNFMQMVIEGRPAVLSQTFEGQESSHIPRLAVTQGQWCWDPPLDPHGPPHCRSGLPCTKQHHTLA